MFKVALLGAMLLCSTVVGIVGVVNILVDTTDNTPSEYYNCVREVSEHTSWDAARNICAGRVR